MCFYGQEEYTEKPAVGTFKKLKANDKVQAYVWTQGVGNGAKEVMVVRVPKTDGKFTEILFKKLRFLEDAVMKFDVKGPSKVFLEAAAKNIMATMSNDKEVHLKDFIDMAAIGEATVHRLSEEKHMG